MSPTHTQSQFCAATPISPFVQCHISFRLLPSSVTTFVSGEILLLITRYLKMTTTIAYIVHCGQNFMYWVCGCGCACEYVCMYMCMYVYIIIKTCNRISSADTSRKQLYMTCGYKTINKTNKKVFTLVNGGTWSVLLGIQGKVDCIEIPKTVALVINWWALSLESLYLISLLIFSFKMLN